MLLCGLEDVSAGMVVAAPVFHPRRHDVELLAPGAPLTPRVLYRLRQLRVLRLWVHHDATEDLDHLIDPTMGQSQVAVYQKLKEDFGKLSQSTVAAGRVQAYRQAIMELVCELVSNRGIAGLSELLAGGPRDTFAHSASVAYLSVLTGLAIQGYVIRQRRHLAIEQARDLTNLGIGAMLHDIGKLQGDRAVCSWHGVTLPKDGEQETLDAYQQHPERGYLMLRNSRAPASATQVVLTHHQRFDGQGFPNMSRITGGRQQGNQAGERIHIFSRIVAAANALDNLLRYNQSRHRPAVAALSRLWQADFDGWFDPVVRDALVRAIPPFAVGGRVTLSDGRTGVVVTPCLNQPCRPIVRLLGEKPNADGVYPVVDLDRTPQLHIAAYEGMDVHRHLFTLSESASTSGTTDALWQDARGGEAGGEA